MKIFGYSVEECLTFFMLIVIGYFIAKMFSQKCNGFSVGAPINCEGITNQANCHNHLRHGCEFKDGKCGYKNAPAGKKECLDKKFKAPHCTSCSNSLHHYPDCTECKERQYKYPKCTDLKDCKELNSAHCALNIFCELDNNNECQSTFLKRLGVECEKNNECQTGVCHSKDVLIEPYKCTNCSNVNEVSCRISPAFDGHSDVCKVNGGKCIYRHCSDEMGGNRVNSCNSLGVADCPRSRNRNDELCYFNNGQCTNKNINGGIYKCKPL